MIDTDLDALLDGLAAVRRRAHTGHGLFWPTPNSRFVMQAGFADALPHKLRHSFASVAGDLGYPEAIIAALLAMPVEPSRRDMSTRSTARFQRRPTVLPNT
jgi:hypothetical protein